MKRVFFYIFIPTFLFLVFGFLWWRNFLSPVNPNDKSTKIFVIPKGESIDSIARRLNQEGLIKNPLGFKLLIAFLGINKNIQAGDFRLSPSWTAKKIAQELTHGVIDIWITIPEGLRVEEVASLISSKFQISPFNFINEARDYEGFLFPDTYLIPKNADTQMIIKIMRNNFDRKVGELIDLEKANRGELKFNGLTVKELITLASLIEREAKYKEDRPKIASVIYNRLRSGMKLDIDASVQYAIATKECFFSDEDYFNKQNLIRRCNWWPKKITLQDLKLDSLYNTYLYPGLPPSPICNPSLDSIKAALFPARTNFWYYLSDKNGKIHYSETFNEHNENIKRYLNYQLN